LPPKGQWIDSVRGQSLSPYPSFTDPKVIERPGHDRHQYHPQPWIEEAQRSRAGNGHPTCCRKPQSQDRPTDQRRGYLPGEARTFQPADPRGAPPWSPKAFRCNSQRTQNRPASEAQQRPERAVQLSTGRAASCPGGGQLQGDFLSRAQILIAAVASPGRARANSDSPVSYVTNSGYGSPWRNASGARSPVRAKA
jgi:hypothetical protein